MKPLPVTAALLALAFASICPNAAGSPGSNAPAGKYRNFDVAIYIPVEMVRQFAEPGRLEHEWNVISSQLRVDKVYIEGERNRVLADDALLESTKQFFLKQGVRVAGGITFSDGGNGQFRSFCYTDPSDRAFVKSSMQLVARHFDEVILDDFFFVTTKYPSDIAAKGNRSWTDFRLDLMDEASRNLVLGAARAVNPRVRVIIKFPNWYEHFAGSGFDLQQEPKIFDGIYTGTETRDPNSTDQYLQQYESYQILRYFDNIAPGRNGGGWVDTYSMRYIDRYAEQLWDTMFAKAREMTLFNWAALLYPAQPGARKKWRSAPTSFDYAAMQHYHPGGATAAAGPETMARVAGYSLDQVDAFLGKLGKPIGIKSYRPPHATGDDFLHNYLGMIGIPIDLYPTFPDDASVVLLTADARGDPDLVAKIKRQLLDGKSVIVTASLYRALENKGMKDIVELEPTGHRFLSDGFSVGFGSGHRDTLTNEVTGAPPILFPEVRFLTNDAWSLVGAMSDGVGYPILLMDRYGKNGAFYVWNIPDNFHNLYELPDVVTSAIKDVVMRGFPVRLDGPAQVSLFAYDNNTFIVESFLSTPVDVTVGTLGGSMKLRDLQSGETLTGQLPAPLPPFLRGRVERRVTFPIHLAPHTYKVFQVE